MHLTTITTTLYQNDHTNLADFDMVASFHLSYIVLHGNSAISKIKVGLLPSRTHTHLFNSPFSMITRVSRYQKGKTNLDFSEARDSVW